jgi:hypothetical protein
MHQLVEGAYFVLQIVGYTILGACYLAGIIEFCEEVGLRDLLIMVAVFVIFGVLVFFVISRADRHEDLSKSDYSNLIRQSWIVCSKPASIWLAQPPSF